MRLPQEILYTLWIMQRRIIPKNSPQLNPIEHMFSKIKNYVRRKIPKNEQDLIKLIIEGSKEITPGDCHSYIVYSQSHLEGCLKKENLY